MQYVLRALAAGKSVLSEKPVASSVADARAAVAAYNKMRACFRAPPVWFVAENFRFEEVFVEAARLVPRLGFLLRLDLRADTPLNARRAPTAAAAPASAAAALSFAAAVSCAAAAAATAPAFAAVTAAVACRRLVTCEVLCWDGGGREGAVLVVAETRRRCFPQTLLRCGGSRFGCLSSKPRIDRRVPVQNAALKSTGPASAEIRRGLRLHKPARMAKLHLHHLMYTNRRLWRPCIALGERVAGVGPGQDISIQSDTHSNIFAKE